MGWHGRRLHGFLAIATDAIEINERRETAREKIFLHDFRLPPLPPLRKFIFGLLVLLSLRATGVTLFGFVWLTASMRITQELATIIILKGINSIIC